MECAECGVDGNKKLLIDVLSSQGIIKLCESCHRGSDMVVLRRPTTFQLKESEKPSSLYRGSYNEFRPGKKEKEATEANLKEIINKNYEASIGERKPRPDLIDNFHWVIMTARRRKKITQEQLAREISESEAAIKMAEKGVLPEDDHKLVGKLESFLGIRISKTPLPVGKSKDKGKGTEQKLEEPARILKFDPDAAKSLTIDDLRQMKKAREESILGSSEKADGEIGEEEDFMEEKEKD